MWINTATALPPGTTTCLALDSPGRPRAFAGDPQGGGAPHVEAFAPQPSGDWTRHGVPVALLRKAGLLIEVTPTGDAAIAPLGGSSVQAKPCAPTAWVFDCRRTAATKLRRLPIVH